MDFSDKRTVLTREGYYEIKRELDEIIKVKRPAVVNRIKEARLLGDLRENFDYHDGKRAQGLLEARIKELQDILKNATVVDCASDGRVSVGSKVVVKDLEDGSIDEYLIVGPAESSPVEGKISYESSMGAALMGKCPGARVEVHTPSGVFECEIVSVE